MSGRKVRDVDIPGFDRQKKTMKEMVGQIEVEIEEARMIAEMTRDDTSEECGEE